MNLGNLTRFGCPTVLSNRLLGEKLLVACHVAMDAGLVAEATGDASFRDQIRERVIQQIKAAEAENLVHHLKVLT